jgi:hypothetical protein
MGSTFAEGPSLYNSANPATLPIHQNTTLLHGTADTIVNISQSSVDGAETIIEAGAGHFDWVHPGTPATRLLFEILKERF